MKEFLYAQKHVAQRIGMTPNYVDKKHLDLFAAWLEEQRKRNKTNAP